MKFVVHFLAMSCLLVLLVQQVKRPRQRFLVAVVLACAYAATVPVHAATPAPTINWATYSTPGSPKLTWQPLGENARGTYYVATYQSPLIGFTFTVKQVTKGLSGRVTQVIFDDFTAACGPHGEPPDQVGAVGSVMIDAASGQYLAQYRSPDFLGTPVNPVPGSVLARATVVACYGRKS